MHLRSFVLSLFVVISFNSCAIQSSCIDSFGFPFSDNYIISNLSDIDDTMAKIAKEIYPTFGGGSVVITDFINSKTYKPTTSGVYLANLLRGHISRNTTARILQLDLAQSFTLNASGLSVLTRKADEILKQKNIALIGIVGSYMVQGKSFHIFVRRINLRSGILISSSTKIIPYYCIGNQINN